MLNINVAKSVISKILYFISFVVKLKKIVFRGGKLTAN